MPKNTRIGIVGLGGIGTLHAETIGALDATVAGGADLNPDARKAFEDIVGAPTYDSHEELLETGDIDGLVVTTPNRYHHDVTIDALRSNTNVLVEKPLANDLTSARRIAAEAGKSEAFCMVGFHNRFSGPARVLSDLIDDGRLGQITHIEANYVRRRGIPGRGTWFTDRSIAGGGALIDVGVHVIDLAIHFMNFPQRLTVLGATRTNFGDKGEKYPYLHMWGEDNPTGTFDVDDSASAFIRSESGVSMSLEVAWAANRPPTHTLYVRGTEGGGTLDIEEGTLTLYETDGSPTDHHKDTIIEVGEDDAYRREQAHFLDAVAEVVPPTQNTVEEGLLVQQIVDAIYRSSESGAAVSIKPLTDKVEVRG